MAFVEHPSKRNYPTFAWAKDIRVKVLGADLQVLGTLVVTETDASTAVDFMREHRLAVRYGVQKRLGKLSPQMKFANANSDEDLIAFVGGFGPVVVSSSRMEECEGVKKSALDMPICETLLIANQNLAELRCEQRTYSAAMKLVAQLQLGKRCDVSKFKEYVPTILEGVSHWPKQWERESLLRAAGQGYANQPMWEFAPRNVSVVETFGWAATREPSSDPLREVFAVPCNPIAAAHNIICELVNAFAPIVNVWGDTPVETPDYDYLAGLRPLLYYALRREYLVKARALAICRNTDCCEIFQVERFGQEFCNDICSRRQRQREYWHPRGKRLRKVRNKRRQPVKKTH